jgi:cell division protein FtsZ
MKKFPFQSRKEPMMNLTFDFDETPAPSAKLRVVGVGGAGGNAVTRMISEHLSGVEFVAVNTDIQALEQCKSPCRIQIGRMTTKGLGAGADPAIGRRAIEESR